MATLVQEKVAQAIGILREQGVDLWLTFVRETPASPDPVLPLIYGHDLTWQSALLLTAAGERVAIVGYYDGDTARRTGAYETIIPYHESLKEPLLQTLQRLDPQSIAINYSTGDVQADGLSYGLYLVLRSYLEGTPFADRLISAEQLIGALRGRKTDGELARIRAAIQTTEEIYRRTFDYLQPGMSERQVAAFMHEQLRGQGLETAWEQASCPAVNSGPDSPVGHAAPTEITLERGHLLHFDFGVRQADYCSDLQRMVYLARPGESAAPSEVERAFATVVRAIEAAVAAMRPGVSGKQVDVAARTVVTGAGYPEYMHATGHHLGRQAHDGGGILGPEWERYGDTPGRLLEPGHVYAVELGIAVPGYGYIGIEENVLVGQHGAEFLSEQQTRLIVR